MKCRVPSQALSRRFRVVASKLPKTTRMHRQPLGEPLAMFFFCRPVSVVVLLCIFFPASFALIGERSLLSLSSTSPCTTVDGKETSALRNAASWPRRHISLLLISGWFTWIFSVNVCTV